MILDPNLATRHENQWVTGLDNEYYQVDSTSIHFTLDRIFNVFDHNSFHISEEGMKEREASELVMTPHRGGGSAFWRLPRGEWYTALSNVHLKLPEDVAVLIATLPEVVGNGLVILDRIIPAGFEGQLQFNLHNLCGDTFITSGTRVGTLTFVEVSSRYPSAGVFA